MPTFAKRAFIAATIALAIGGTAAAATDDVGRFAITPFVSYRDGGDFDAFEGTANPQVDPSFAYGVALSMSAGVGRSFELLYTLQQTEIEHTGLDLDIEHLHVGGSATYDENESFIPFIAGGIGFSRLKADRGDDETRFSASLGLGVHVPINDRFHVRIEMRGYFVTMDGDHALFCRSSSAGGNCLVRAAGDLFFQYEALAGVAVGFGAP